MESIAVHRLLSIMVLSASVVCMRGFAQVSLPFPPDGAPLLWKYNVTGGMVTNGRKQIEYDGEEVELGGRLYKVLRWSHYYEWHDGPGSYSVDEAYHAVYCHLRSDSAGITYIHSTEYPPEEILFDPSIEVGDVMPETWRLTRRYWYDGPVTVSSIGTVVDNQGVSRRVWHFDTPGTYEDLSFIEGLGCNLDFLGLRISQLGPDLALNCATYAGLSIWGDQCIPMADPDDQPIDTAAQGPLLVLQDGVSGSYRLNRTATGAVFDAVGRTIVPSGPNERFTLFGTRPGMYIFRTEEGEVARFFHQ